MIENDRDSIFDSYTFMILELRKEIIRNARKREELSKLLEIKLLMGVILSRFFKDSFETTMQIVI